MVALMCICESAPGDARAYGIARALKLSTAPDLDKHLDEHL